MPSIQIIFFSNQFQCISRVKIHPKTHGNYQTTLNPSHFRFGRIMHKPYSIFFTLITQIQCLIPQFHKSLTNFNISYKIQHQTLTIHSLDFSNPNLIHFFLNFYQNHHDLTLNTTILPSIPENQNISYGKHQNPTFPPLKTYLFLVFLGSSLLIPLVDHLKSLKKEKKSHLPLLHLSPHTFSPFSFLSFLFSLFFPLSFIWPSKHSSFLENSISSIYIFNLHFAKITLKPHNLIG